MRHISDATKVAKATTKVLAVLEKENLTPEQMVSVLKMTNESIIANDERNVEGSEEMMLRKGAIERNLIHVAANESEEESGEEE